MTTVRGTHAKRAGATGAVPRGSSDRVLVTTGNAAQNKIDYFLQRSLDYDLELFPSGDEAEITARGVLSVALENTAPATGLPSYIIGSNRPDYAAGENGTFFSAYSPLELGQASVDGEVTGFEQQRELGSFVYSKFLRIPAETTTTVDLDLTGRLRLRSDGWYDLALGTQPSVRPDAADVTLRLPDDWRFADARGGVAISDDGHEARFRGTLDRDRRLRLRIVRDHGDGIWGRLRDGRPL